eukprot:scaffold14635_cov201-Amphora_coffeaeformis.AAC.8
MSNAKFHALAAAASSILRKHAPTGARAWSRALPALEVCMCKSMAEEYFHDHTRESRPNFVLVDGHNGQFAPFHT